MLRRLSQQLFGYVEEDREESFRRNTDARRGVTKIALVGECGVGKASFVNTMRG